MFWQEFHPTSDIYAFEEHSSGVRTPNFGELEQRCLTLEKKTVMKNLLVKLLRAPF